MSKRENKFSNEDEHDKTKSMLDMLRNSSDKSSINEEEAEPLEEPSGEQEPESQMNVVRDEPSEEDAIEPSSEQIRDEKEKFRENIDSRVEFETFKIYPQDRNVVFAGKFQGFGGLYWQFSLDERDGVYVSVENLQLDEDALEILQKLNGYYKNWVDEWAIKVVEEYTGQDNEEEQGI